ncbi:MAG TPA: hypothetical protein VF550_08250 [Polyangia bacterium]
MDRWIWLSFLTLHLVWGGLFLSTSGCTSQTAIAIVATGADASTRDSAFVGPDGVADVVLRDADGSTGDSATAPDFPDALSTADAFAVLPEASLPETAGRETAPEVASLQDTLSSGPVTLFSDAFNGGYEVNWQLSVSSDGPVTNARDGNNPIVTLDSTQTDYSRLRGNIIGDLFTAKDVTASMRMRVEQAPSSTRTIRLDVRQADTSENIFYAVGAVVATDGSITNVVILKKVPDGAGNYTMCQLAAGPVFATPIAMNQWRRVKLTVSGTSSVRLVAFFDELQVATFTDDCNSTLTATNGATVANGGCLADQTGLGIQVEKGLKASVDDVLVTTP